MAVHLKQRSYVFYVCQTWCSAVQNPASCSLDKQKLSKYFPDINPLCNHSNSFPTTYAHMFWYYIKLQEFWSLIFKTVTECQNQTITQCPFLGMFGTPPDPCTLYKLEAVLHLLLCLSDTLFYINGKMLTCLLSITGLDTFCIF